MDTEKMSKKETLLKEIETQRALFNTDRLDVSFGEIMNMYEKGEIIVKPDFQRYFRWDEEQRTRFIESLLLGIPIPPIFVAEDGSGVWELVDGLQRVSTVLSFFGVLKSKDEGVKSKNNWSLTEGDIVEALEGFDYKTIPNQFRLNIKRATCRVEILRWNSNYDIRFELFNRLNTGGSTLTPQEIRNCIYRDISSTFNDFLKKLTENDDFRALTDLNDEQYERMYDQELVLRFISLYENINSVKSGLARHMSSFMENSLKDKNFDYSTYEKIFSQVFTILRPLGKGIFRNKKGRFTPIRYDIITVGVGENYDLYKSASPKIIEEKIDQIDNSVVSGDNQKSRIINRLKEAKRIFGKK